MILREVILSHEAQDVLDRESQLHLRLTEVYRGLEWRLSRNPSSGYQKDAANWIVRLDGNLAAKIPGVVVLYQFNENQVAILAMLIKVPHAARVAV